MRPSRTDEDALVDLLDVLLRDGVIVEADVIVSVADIPLVGVKLRAAIAGMTTMTEYGMFESFDSAHRARAMEGDVQREPVSRVDGDLPDEVGKDDVPTEDVASPLVGDAGGAEDAAESADADPGGGTEVEDSGPDEDAGGAEEGDTADGSE